MKKIFLILMMMCFFSCQAQITQVDSMKEIFQYFNDANSKTLAIFDVDMVLVQPRDPAFQMANMKRYSSISKRIMKEIPPEKQMIFLGLMTIHSEPILIDEQTPLFLQQLEQKGIPAIAMTANLTGRLDIVSSMETSRINGLKALGIDFSRMAPTQESFVFENLASYRGNYCTYLNGIFFVNGTVVSKGEAFLAFIERTQFYPDRVIFVDDREENLKSLEAAIQKLGRAIEYQGLHYTGAQKYPSKEISEREFELRWQELALKVKALEA